MASSALIRAECIVKIKFGNILRRVTYSRNLSRFSSSVWSPELTFETLQSQIRWLFEIPSSTQFSVTYTDAENDVITIGDKDDLMEVTPKQPPGIPLRMEVTLLASRGQTSFGDQISWSNTNEAVKQLMTQLLSAFESTKLQIQAYEALPEETNSATLVENLLQITMGLVRAYINAYLCMKDWR